MSDLPVNVDATYDDSSVRPSVKLHQQHHDTLHTFYNLNRGHFTALSGAHPASAIGVTPSGNIISTNVQDALLEIAGESAQAHIETLTDAHDASAISFVPSGSITANDTQAAILEVSSSVSASAADLSSHITNIADAHDASAISFTSGGSVAATDVQAAILEVASDAAANLSSHVLGTVDVHDASAISYAGGVGLVAVNIEEAIDELAVEKADTANAVMDGDAAGGALAGTFPNPSFAVDMATQAELADHINDLGAAHAASAVAFTPGSGLLSTTVQSAVEEAVGVASSTLAAHLSDTADAHDASAVSVAAIVGMAATDVQTALAELQTELSQVSVEDIFSITDYGGVGNGVADDTSAAVAMFAAVTANGGGVALFPVGRWRITSIVNVSANTIVMGRGPGSIVDCITDSSVETVALRADNVDNVTFYNLRFDCSNSVERISNYGLIRCHNSAHIQVLNCEVSNSPTTSMFFWQCDNLLIAGNLVRDGYADGIHISRGCTDIKVIGNHVTRTGDDGIALVSRRVTGAESFLPCQRATIVGNTIEDLTLGRGMTCGGSREVTIVGNTIKRTDQAGIIISADAATYYYARDIIIAGNVIDTTGRQPPAAGSTQGIVAFEAVRNVLVQNNTVRNTVGDGIAFGLVVSCNISNNLVEEVGVRGISLTQASSTDATLLTEIYTEAGETAPGTALSSRIGINNNTVQGCVSDAIRVSGQAIPNRILDCVITGNITDKSGDDGVETVNVLEAIVSNNRLRSNTTGGIRANTVQQFTAIGNQINGCVNGIAVGTTSGRSTVIGNTISAGTGVGVSRDATSGEIICVGNDLVGAATPVSFGGTTAFFEIGNLGIVVPDYTTVGTSTDRTYDIATVTTSELANVLGTLIADLQARGLLR